MLEFIVLGKIPGTDFYFSFTTVSLVMTGAAICIYSYRLKFSQLKRSALKQIEEVSI